MTIPPAIMIPDRERWKRDPYVMEMVRTLDQPDRVGRLDLLTRKEWEAIALEVYRCQESFEYASRNYFRIVDKNREDVPFFLWESQELILEKLHWIKSKGIRQLLMCLKSRQLGCSTLIEALIAHHTIFFPNRLAIVISYDQQHSQRLFGMMTYILDQLPWWLRPMIGPRKYETGLHFINPDPEMRRRNLGMNSRILVQSAQGMGGIGGEGDTITAFHGSEIPLWEHGQAKDVIDRALPFAMPLNPDCFAVLEFTGKPGRSYAHNLWKASIKLGEKAQWYPLFLPFFFEKKRFIAPPNGWRPDKSEDRVRERTKRDWLRCDNARCGEYRETMFEGQNLENTPCPACRIGTLRPFVLADGQLCYLEYERINAAEKGMEAIKEFKAQLATTPQEAWQLSGIQVFPEDCFEWVNSTIDNSHYIEGNVDAKGNIHWVMDRGTGKCGQSWCLADHRFDPEKPLKVWDWPEEGKTYSVGVDVAEGLGGDHDYSVIWINRLGDLRSPDVHVATYRSNTITPVDLAGVVNALGRAYNNALVAIEYNTYTTVADNVKQYYQYPNLFRWKHYDNVGDIRSNKYHWETTPKSKPKLWLLAVRHLRANLWVVRDQLFYFEMETFQKESETSRKAQAESGEHDDTIMAACIALFAVHDLDWDESAQDIQVPVTGAKSLIEPPEWKIRCLRCHHEWEAAVFYATPEPGRTNRCQRCGSILVNARRVIATEAHRNPFDEILGRESDTSEPQAPVMEYALL